MSSIRLPGRARVNLRTSVSGWQKAFSVAREEKFGCGTPFLLLLRGRGLDAFTGPLNRRLDLNSFEAVTGEASQQPKKYTDHQRDLYLCGREIPEENVDQCYGPANDAYIAPRHNPVADPNVEMHINSTR